MDWPFFLSLLTVALLYLIAFRLDQLVNTMKIIEKKLPVSPVAALTCAGCKSKLEVTRADIQSDRDGDYIKCPVCNKFNGVPAKLMR